MSAKILGAFRETMKVGEDQSLAELMKDEAARDQLCAKIADAVEKPFQSKRPKKPWRYSFAPH